MQGIETVADLSDGLKRVYRDSGLSYSQLDARARALPGTPGLARSTLGDMFNGKLASRETLRTFLAVAGISPADQQQWLTAWQRVRSRGDRCPPGAVRVRDVSPREIGVHAAIRERDSSDDLPPYITRDFDTALRAAVSAGVDQGCFLILVGSSSVGKTRSAYEAVLTLVPEWWLVQPATAANICAMAGEPFPRTVLWLDELQRYLVPGEPVCDAVRAFRRAGAIVIGTLWPDEYLSRTAPARSGEPERSDRELLRMAHVIDVAETFSREEHDRATALSHTDGRIHTALSVSDTGPVQVLAAGPALVRWWEQAPNPYARAVITAAADARRLGVRSPLPRAFFTDAAGGYLTANQRATAPDDWLSAALDHALTPLHGAAATLNPVPPAENVLGTVAGYLVADYLLQHARRTRRTTVPPAEWWQSCGRHCRDDDLRRLADAARARARFQCVEWLYRPRAEQGDAEAADSLAELLSRQGRRDEAITVLQAAAEGVPFATSRLARLLIKAGRADEAVPLFMPPRNGRWNHADELVKLLTRLDRADEAVAVLRSRSDTDRLVSLLVRLKRSDEATTVLRERADDPSLKWRLAFLLERKGEIDEAVALLSTCTEYESLARELVDMLVRHNRVDELRARSDQGDEYATHQLADVLAEQGRATELAALVDSRPDSPFAFVMSHWLGEVLAEQNDMEELRVRADAGDSTACFRLAEMLIERNRLDEVRARADAGDWHATLRLAQHLEDQNRVDDAIEVLRASRDPVETASWLQGLLLKQGRIDEAIQAAHVAAEKGELTEVTALNHLLGEHNRLDELRARAEDGDDKAAWTLATTLYELDRVDEALEALALGKKDHGTAWRRAEWLHEQGRIDDLRDLVRSGDDEAARRLINLLAERGLIDELRILAGTDVSTARSALIGMLADRGELDELRDWADKGEHFAAGRLLRLLAAQGNLAALRAEVDAGTDNALEELVSLLTARGLLDRHGAKRLHRFGFSPEGRPN